MKTTQAITAIQQDRAEKTPLLSIEINDPDFIAIYKNDDYHDKYYRFYEKHQANYWTKEKVSIAEDLPDWNSLPEKDKNLILNIMRVFTQADASVLDGYTHLMKIFSPVAIKMMLGDFLAREGIHADSYSVFTDTIGKNADFYTEFLDVPEMTDKFIYMQKSKVKPFSYYEELSKETGEPAKILYIRDVIRMMATYSLFVEGIELFAMFSILFSYRVHLGKMRRLATVVEWSIRDESQHVGGNAELMKDIFKLYPTVLNDELRNDIYMSLEEVIQQEHAYIDILFDSFDNITNITKDELKQFVQYIGNTRLQMINFEVKNPTTNPFTWLDEVLFSPTLVNFFDDVVSEYSENLKGNRNSVRENLKNIADIVLK